MRLNLWTILYIAGLAGESRFVYLLLDFYISYKRNMKNIRINWLVDEPYALCLAYCESLKMGVSIKDLQMEGCI